MSHTTDTPTVFTSQVGKGMDDKVSQFSKNLKMFEEGQMRKELDAEKDRLETLREGRKVEKVPTEKMNFSNWYSLRYVRPLGGRGSSTSGSTQQEVPPSVTTTLPPSSTALDRVTTPTSPPSVEALSTGVSTTRH
jgi:hypothetical protein